MANDDLDASSIKQNLKIAKDLKIKIFDAIDSTNNECKRKHLIEPHLVVADHQTNGRGQFAHHFYSPKSTGIYMTIVVPAQKRFIINPGELTAGVGNSVVQAIFNLTNKKLQLKWINDIYQNHKKCGGILVETNMNDHNQIQSFIVGIGLNLYPSQFPSQIKQRAGAIFEHRIYSRNRLIASICDCFYHMYHRQSQDLILKTYQSNMLWMNQHVTLNDNGYQLVGTIVDINSNFQLVLKDLDGRIHNLKSNLTHQMKPTN
ncbi:bifunctional ligase/repressor BirA [Philodulcilactobacillus myokoensis]|uniref:Bifunctional ligase/repressor BirA n=1 Tax=Philodulcilactobacillus myokoensis TaxID=2929573 RepID=A0A9W6B0B1_9LACO|nr:biotin--[acetyl-CoA-carboxylase] ligase [Philodulcilactobacillus myokoensis]GLB46482.1 bifunctional ligase/repressor BirA [Philodulcilactobacillus myokoensis]